MVISELEKNQLRKYQTIFDFSDAFRNKTFLVTGSKGLLGQGIIKWLLLLNIDQHLNILIYASTRNPLEKPEYIGDDDNIIFCEFGKEEETIAKEHIDFIIHAASPTGNTYHKLHPYESLRVILDETEHMVDICQKNSDCNMVYMSSEEIYGLPNFETAIKEDYVGAIDSLNQRSCYPLGKKAAELLCFNNVSEYNTDIKIVRPTVIQGLFQPYSEQRVVNEILRCVLEDKDLVLKSSGKTKKCLMYSLDAISGIFMILLKGKRGKAYNISNPSTFMTVYDLANHIFKKFSPHLHVLVSSNDESVSLGYLPQRSLLQDISRSEEIGWRPITSLDEIYQIDILRFRKE
jgi:UDP-glucuronate decarboxylase